MDNRWILYDCINVVFRLDPYVRCWESLIEVNFRILYQRGYPSRSLRSLLGEFDRGEFLDVVSTWFSVPIVSVTTLKELS